MRGSDIGYASAGIAMLLFYIVSVLAALALPIALVWAVVKLVTHYVP